MDSRCRFNRTNGTWKNDLLLAISGIGKLSYEPDRVTLEAVQNILLRLEARVKVTQTKKKDTLIEKTSKKAQRTFYGSKRQSLEALLKRYRFLLTPPFISYEDKKAKLAGTNQVDGLKKKFQKNINTGT